MIDKIDNQSILLEQCSEDLLLTIPRLMHCFRPHGNCPLGYGSQLSMGQGRLLLLISCGEKSVSDLAEKSRVSLPTISRKIDLLVEKGLVDRERDPEDRRSLVLEITEDGKHTLDQHRRHANKQLSAILESLTDAELQQIRKSLKLLRKAFHIPESESTICP